MKFKKLNGYVNENSSYISIEIEGGNNNNSIGDQVWFSEDGTIMEILDYCDKDIIMEVKNMFIGNSKKAFLGALMRMGINI